MLEIKSITAQQWPQYEQDVLAIEAMAFSAAQCHPASYYLNILNSERQVSYIALVDGKVAGFLFCGPLEMFAQVAGVTDDPHFGQNTVLYDADIAVNPDFRNQGIAKKLKQQQIIDAKTLGYQVIAARNRVKYAHVMWCINQSLGAVEIQHLTGIYKDGREPNACVYNHLVL